MAIYLGPELKSFKHQGFSFQHLLISKAVWECGLKRIFRDPGLVPGEKKTLKLALLENEEFIFPAVIFITQRKNLLLKPNLFWLRIYCLKSSIKTCASLRVYLLL